MRRNCHHNRKGVTKCCALKLPGTSSISVGCRAPYRNASVLGVCSVRLSSNALVYFF